MTDGERAGVGDGPYQSLYRRFRPQRLAELRGQEHVSLALRNAVRDGRVGHAYLFSGPRGTGKTSAARILAKALNCTVADDGEPCTTCESCRAITEGSSFDVHELDAASNNGVEAMRDLVARAALSSPGRWKVYIVDEVHMLSAPASNALLKTLEEPPPHVIFVLATTDPHKVLPTIRSRTQHFEFHLLSEETLTGLLADVAREAALTLPPGALSAAVRRGRGSARDALSVLDQIAAAGVVDDDSGMLTRVIEAIGEHDSEAAIVGLDQAMRAGHDAQQLATALVEQLRAGFLGLASGGALSDGPSTLHVEELEAVRALGLVRCVRALEVIGVALVAMRESPEPRVTLEVALIRLTHPDADSGPEALLERLERLERRLDSLAGGATPERPRGSPAGGHGEVPAPPPPRAPLSEPPRGTPTEAPPEVGRVGAEAEEEEQGQAAAAETARPRPALGAFRAPEPSATATPQSAQPPAGESEAAPVAEPILTRTPAREPERPPPGAPTRDELVLAWGDHVIQRLRPKVRAVFQIGRFVGCDGEVALLAVPNAGHLAHAEPLVGEVAEALSQYFGVPVTIRLVTEETAAASGQYPAQPPAEAAVRPQRAALTEEPFDEIGEAAEEGDGEVGGVALARDRLLRAFPGAEEVDRA